MQRYHRKFVKYLDRLIHELQNHCQADVPEVIPSVIEVKQ